MALRKYNPAAADSMTTLNLSKKLHEREQFSDPEITVGSPMETDVDIDLREVYFLIIHFLSSGPCRRTYAQFWNELLEHQLLPRRFHAWYSRKGEPSGDENDNGNSLPLNYSSLRERYPHIEQDHLVKLLKQLLLTCSRPSHGLVGGTFPNAADVPTLLGSGSFSLLGSSQDMDDQKTNQLPGYLRWPHIHSDQVRGLSLREIGGGFSKHHRSSSVRAACYAIAKPSTMLQKMEIKKRLRGHRNAVYCAIFDRSGRYVITGSDDRLVKIWSMETAFCLASCRGHEGDITDLAVSSNNALVASASNDFIIRVWRLPDGLPISVLRGHTGAVTAIVFSPRPTAVYQLLSSSDDGTCRIWDARYSQSSPRVYVPKPPEAIPGKSSQPSSSSVQQSHQILCCAFNANGTVFVTGSSDTYARVWNAFKTTPEDAEQPNHEMDLLSGHENDVNYVQFSGCAVPSRSAAADTSKEDNLPKFKNSWFTHDNIVTCSRDGSAIIWIPRSRRSHGKVGRWTRAYHLKVPPPPVPPQPPRGGPRQRLQPTPRGVNMIVWSLDNRFVLAAIMDCRICVWNASDGSLVHSLMGHSESTFVLDVHPFNPRIAMSAGYDGRTIIWDIWEGTPVRIYETGRFKLVDGKFSPDGTSIVLSDEVGQIFIIATGQGGSHEDAKYDQFFLGDYRPLIQDTHGNVLDQETQLPPHRRNMQDLLCDSSMIPYPEPYQSMYQRRRLGALGIEWHPPSVKFAVGPADNINGGDYQFPLIDLDRWVEPVPEFLDAMDWEQENEVQSDDTDSEYDATEEFSSEGDGESAGVSSSGDSECSAEDSEEDHASKEGLRRSKRKIQKAEVEVTTSSGRRVKRRNLDERDGTISKKHRTRRSRNGKSSGKKSSKSKSLRPQRRAARNALTLFSQINGASTDGEDEGASDTDSSDSESMLRGSNTPSNESDHSILKTQVKQRKQKEVLVDEYEDASKASQVPNSLIKKRLVLKLPVRDRKERPSGNAKIECHQLEDEAFLSAKSISNGTNLNGTYPGSYEQTQSSAHAIGQSELSSGYKGGTIKWGEVKTRSTKRLRLSESSAVDARHTQGLGDVPNVVGYNSGGHLKSEDEHGLPSSSENQADVPYRKDVNDQSAGGVPEGSVSSRSEQPGPGLENESKPLSPNVLTHGVIHPLTCNGHRTRMQQLFHSEDLRGTGINGDADQPVDQVASTVDNVSCLVDKKPIYRRLKIKSSRLTDETVSPSSKLKSVAIDDWNSECDLTSDGPMKAERNLISVAREADEGTSGQSPYNSDWNSGSGRLETWEGKNSRLSISQDSDSYVDSYCKKYNAVYKRSNSSKSRKNLGSDAHHIEGSTSNYDHRSAGKSSNSVYHSTSVGAKHISNLSNGETHCGAETSKTGGKSALNGCEQFLSDKLKSTSKMTVGLRSQRNRRENYNACDLSPLGKRRNHHSMRKTSWLMLSEHEEGYRYIPQLGDEVVYLRQGHEEYLIASHSREVGPWKKCGSLKAVELCKIVVLDYSPLPGSGESCCKLTLEFIDPSSSAFHKTICLTLPELVAFPDFLVEKTRYDAAIERNWTQRDKCQVWWRNEDEGGSWWEGRIVAVKAKSPDFPDSPWERFVVQYKNDSSGLHPHSPWELHDVDGQWEHPHIDERSRDVLLSVFANLEQESLKNRDHHGIQRLKQVAVKSDFLNRFPVPLLPEVIRRRLENNYYRSLDAVKHDISVAVSNATTYFSKNAELLLKIQRWCNTLTHFLASL